MDVIFFVDVSIGAENDCCIFVVLSGLALIVCELERIFGRV